MLIVSACFTQHSHPLRVPHLPWQRAHTMNRSIVCILFVVILVGVTHAALTAREFWETTMNGSPMPASIRDLLQPGMAVRPRGFGCTLGYSCRWNYHKSSSGAATADMPQEDIFFLQKDLRPGATMRLDTTRSSPAAAFIPHGEASVIPFSSENLPDLVARFSVHPNSADAQAMKETLQDCEAKDASEQSKYCATSLESMVDFATSALGTRAIRAVSSEIAEGAATPKLQEYTMASSPMQTLAGSSYVSCHPRPWPHALFYCHISPASRAYIVRLVGRGGAPEVDAVVVCHDDTSNWDPAHLAFQMLKVKPGTLPICHFLPVGHILFGLSQ